MIERQREEKDKSKNVRDGQVYTMQMLMLNSIMREVYFD